MLRKMVMVFKFSKMELIISVNSYTYHGIAARMVKRHGHTAKADKRTPKNDTGIVTV